MSTIDTLMTLGQNYGWAVADYEDRRSDEGLDAKEMAEQEFRSALVTALASVAPAQSLPPPDIHTPGVPRGHGAISAYSPAGVAEITAHLRGQMLVLASLLEQALEVVRNVEAEDSDEGEQLMNLINTGTEAVRAVLTEHAMTQNPTEAAI